MNIRTLIAAALLLPSVASAADLAWCLSSYCYLDAEVSETDGQCLMTADEHPLGLPNTCVILDPDYAGGRCSQWLYFGEYCSRTAAFKMAPVDSETGEELVSDPYDVCEEEASALLSPTTTTATSKGFATYEAPSTTTSTTTFTYSTKSY